jgi:streptogramin lyase
MGMTRAASGEPLGGIAVSAREEGKTFTITVLTDEQGEYFFPPLEPPFASGKYRVWAQAVGYETAHAELNLDSPQVARQDFTLKTIKDFTLQLSGSEWMDALPADTFQDKRLKEIFRVNCTECHQVGLVLQNRFDEQGWLATMDWMERATYHGWSGPGARPSLTIQYHKQELAKYLAKIRGPEPFPLKFKLHPRPKGDAARVVVTEYDIPTGVGKKELSFQSGNDWSQGIVSGMRGTGGTHDIVVDDSGNAWLTDSVANVDRTLVKVDARTGEVKAFKLTAPDGKSARSAHGIAKDPKGNLWFDTDGSLGSVDPATEKFALYTPPSPIRVGGQIDVAPNGKVWAPARHGGLLFDPEMKKFTFFQDLTVGDGDSYGATADANGNGWWTQFKQDIVSTGQASNHQSFEVPMRPPGYEQREEMFYTPADREFYNNIGALKWAGSFAVPGTQAPRRLGADKNGNTVWVANWWGMNLARIDIKTRKTTYYPLPIHANPYNAVVDKNHVVWTNLMSDDAVARLDPKTEQWTVYKLPSIGTTLRHITVDDARGDVWVPYREASRAARLQFRTQAQLLALKAASNSASAAAR